MKILFLPSWYPNDKSPYDGNFIQNHAIAISKFATVIVIFATSKKGISKAEIVTQHSHPNLEERLIYFPYSDYKLIRFYRKLKSYWKLLGEAGSYNLIHSHVFFPMGFLAFILAFAKNKKWVNTEHSSYFHQLEFPKRTLFRLLSQRVNLHTPVSQDLQKTLMKLDVCSDKIVVIPNTIDTAHFQLKEKKVESIIRFLHISAYHDKRKNVEGILRVIQALAKKYTNFILEIGGDGDEDWLQKTLSHYRIPEGRVELKGKYTYADLPQVYSQADAFVLFSDFENFGMVLAESICCGTPVIATKVGGVPDFVNKDNGTLILVGDENALFDAMERFILGKQKYQYHPTDVRNSIVGYVAEQSVGNEYIQVYNHLLKN